VPAVPDRSALADQLVAAARTQGVELTGPGGLLTGLTKRVLEAARDVKLSEHLGHEHGEPSDSSVRLSRAAPLVYQFASRV
jgi:hypothetical protein